VTTAHVVLELDGERVRGATLDGDAIDPTTLPELGGPALLSLARRHPDASIAWRERSATDLLTDPAGWGALLTHSNQVRSAALLHGDDAWLATVGAADFDSALQLPPPDDRAYGSWLLSPLAGVAAAAALLAAGAPPDDLPFPAWALVLGHRAYRSGAFLWSDPALVRVSHRSARRSVHSARSVAAAVRYCFGRRFLLPWLAALDGRRLRAGTVAAVQAGLRPDHGTTPAPVTWPLEDPELEPPAIDVVIPTLSRRELLLGVLDDLAEQTLRPRRVVVVEQTGTGQPGLTISAEGRPYVFAHLVVERLGAGNARNVGLGHSDAPWVLLLDDDVRFGPDMLALLWARTSASGAEAVTAHLDDPVDGMEGSAPRTGEPPALRMWPGFGTAAALVHRPRLDEAGGFDRRIDGGFGEDTELGVRLRQAGAMVALASEPALVHLKAPVGGMRAPYPHPWRADPDRPRPSPTIVFSRSTYETPEMSAGYRIHWWLDAARQDGWHFRPLRRLRQWRAARRWAIQLEHSEPVTSARAVPPEDPASTPRRPPGAAA
jgi:glycosyltransferase involved in cell wall biosynthesis